MSIAYKDSSSFGKRTYLLDGDVIVVKAIAISGTEHEVRLDVGQLDPNYDSLKVRGPLLIPLAFITLVGLVGTSILSGISSLSHLTYPFYACLFMSGFGILFGTLSLKRTRLVRFKNASGVPAFDVFEAGPEKARFESFVWTVQNEIKKRRG